MRSHTTIVLTKSTSEHVPVLVTRSPYSDGVIVSEVTGGHYARIDIEDPAIGRELIARLAEVCSEVEREQADKRAKRLCAERSAPQKYRPCDECGGETWMYTNARDLRCALCNHEQSAWPPPDGEHARPMSCEGVASDG